MEPFSLTALALTAARLIAAHGDGLLDLGSRMGEKLADKGADALAATGVASLIGWLKARAGASQGELEAATTAAVASRDEASIQVLADAIQRIADGAEAELTPLVRVAEEASTLTVIGQIKVGVMAGDQSTTIIHGDVNVQ